MEGLYPPIGEKYITGCGNSETTLRRIITMISYKTLRNGSKEQQKSVFCQVLFPEKSVGIPFFQQGIFPAFSGHYASLRMRACSIR